MKGILEGIDRRGREILFANKVVITVIALSLAAGLLGGYLIWGTKDAGEIDIKQLLRTLEKETDRIEQRNRDLVASIEKSRGEIEESKAVRQENQALKEQLQHALREKTELEGSLSEPRTKEADAGRQATEIQGLRTMLEELKRRNAELANETRELKYVIDNISEITKRNPKSD